LEAMAAALDRPPPPDRGPEVEAAQADARAARDQAETARAAAEAAQAELAAAQERIAALEDAPAPAAPEDGGEAVRMRAALEALTASAAQLREQHDGAADASLRAEVDALKAARAMDLAEMRAILAELEPMMETSHA